jgi:membrane protein
MRIAIIPSRLVAVFLRFYRRTEQAELDLIAAGVAFYGFLAIFPAAAAIIALWGYISDPSIIRAELLVMKEFLPPTSFELIKTQVEALLALNASRLGWTTLLSTVFALWSTRAGAAALIRGLNAIHNLPNRSGHRHQLRARALTVGMIALALCSMTLGIIVPLIIGYLPKTVTGAVALYDTNHLLSFLVIVLAIGLAYRYGPNHRQARPAFFSWGLMVAVVLWMLAAQGLVFYLAHFPSYNQVYGSIGAVAALLMWLYFSAYAILLGAAVDAETQRARRAVL